MKFRVEITETLKRGIIVEAQNADAALDIVKKHYNEEDIILDGSDFDDTEFKVYRKLSQKNVWSLAKHMNGS